jgi:hypothetical protein
MASVTGKEWVVVVAVAVAAAAAAATAARNLKFGRFCEMEAIATMIGDTMRQTTTSTNSRKLQRERNSRFRHQDLHRHTIVLCLSGIISHRHIAQNTRTITKVSTLLPGQ